MANKTLTTYQQSVFDSLCKLSAPIVEKMPNTFFSIDQVLEHFNSTNAQNTTKASVTKALHAIYESGLSWRTGSPPCYFVVRDKERMK